jgi:hypothetical protein
MINNALKRENHILYIHLSLKSLRNLIILMLSLHIFSHTKYIYRCFGSRKQDT